MANCSFCGMETKLFVAGEPVCAACSDLLDAGQRPPRKDPGREKSSGTMNGTTGKTRTAGS
ncbi:MAG TPA: hypothetical protein VGL82_16745 [Bryobacteraceae bacterium]